MSQFIEREAAVEDDDSEDDDDVSVPSKQTKKRRRTDDAALRFIDRDAEVEGEEDEDDEDEDEGEALQDEADYDAADVRKDETEHRRFDAQRRKEEDERLRQQVEERYADGAASGPRYADDDEEGSGRFTSLPDAQKDPKLWLMRCKPGHEKMLVIQLMQKYLDASQSEQPLLIKSAMCSDVKGYIYIEAYREAHVREATQGLNNLFFRIALVPPREMTDVMRVRVTPKARLVKGSWARWKAKPQKGGEDYVGDLCQVMDVDVDGTHAAVRMVPRLAIFVEHVGDDDKKQKVRPPARLFVSDEVQAAGGDVETGRERGQYFHDGMTFHNGFLMRDRVNVRSLRFGDDITPSLQELERFRVDSSDDALLAGGLASRPKASFAKDDIVRVVDGDLKHLVGVVQDVSADGSTVVILPKHEQLTQPLSFQAELLAKFFTMGSHVKVIGGSQHLGETGLVVRVDEAGAKGAGGAAQAVYGTTLTIFSDLTHQEVEVRAIHVQECADVSAGLERLGVFELHDMVMLDRAEVGVVIKVEHSSFKVLTTKNTVDTVPLQRMGRKKTSRGVVALDPHQQRLEVGSPVRLLEGKHKGMEATVKHIFKASIFVHSNEIPRDQAGITCVKARGCELLDGGNVEHLGIGFGGGAGGGATSTGRLAVPQSPGQMSAGRGRGMLGGGFGPGGGGPGMGGPQGGPGGGAGRGRNPGDELRGKTVTITRGGWKGYLGVVKSTQGEACRVELHGKEKTVMVKREFLVQRANTLAGAGSAPGRPAGGPAPSAGGWTDAGGSGWNSGGGGGGWDNDGGRTPSRDTYGGRTPSANDFGGGRTPMHDSMAYPQTPMHNDGSRTPMHDQSVWDPSKTPMHEPAQGGGFAMDDQYGGMGGGFDQFGGMGGINQYGGGGFGGGGFNSMSASGSQQGLGSAFGESPFGVDMNAGPPGYQSLSASQSHTGGDTPNSQMGGTWGGVGGGFTPQGTPGGGFTPQGTPGGMTPGTPHDAGPPVNILPVGIQATITATGKKATIREADERGYSLMPDDETKAVRAGHGEVEVVPPAKRDKLMIISGEHKGQQGTLIGIDGDDGIVKLAQTMDITILSLKDLAKYIG